MPNPYFEFKKFTVWHDRCAMKVGTDGVLLGAWAPVGGCKRVLDIGTGTGLIALQMAQRSSTVKVVAVELDEAAAAQAQENVNCSPWSERIEVVCSDFNAYLSDEKFDLLVSNPPYFVDSLRCPDSQRDVARHAGGLNYESLFRRAGLLLQPTGCVALIVPAEVEAKVMDAAGVHAFYRYHCVRVFSKPGKPCRRLLLLFGMDPLHSTQEETLYISQEKGEYSMAYKALTGDFYLKM